MISQSLKVNLALFVTCILVVIPNHKVIAAEKITFGYGMATQSVSFAELATFAETGELSPKLKFLFEYGKQNPQTIRWILTQQFPASPKLIGDLLNTPPGEYLLAQIGNTIGTRSERANVTAFRGALIAAASNDRQLSLLEVLHYYPTQQVYVDGKLLFRSWRNLQNLLEKPKNAAKFFSEFTRFIK